MSGEVDRRIVELRFDNAQFASAVKNTMTQLDDLNRALSMKQATDGLDQVENRVNRFSLKNAISAVQSFFTKIGDKLPFVNIQALENRFNSFKNSGAITAIDNFLGKFKFNQAKSEVDTLEKKVNDINLTPAEQAVVSLEKRFSTLGIIGATAISKVTEKVLGLAGGLVSSVITPVVSGGYQRAQNIENARFTLQGLLSDAGQVQEIMDAAMASVDNTAYGFDEAAIAASMFAATGVRDFNTMLPLLKGVAGTAATLNADYADISHVFTTVAGNGRLMTEQLNQLAVKGMNAAATLKDEFNAVLAGAVPTEGENSIPAHVQEAMRRAVEYGIAEIKDFDGTMEGISEGALRALVTNGQISFDIFSNLMTHTFGAHAADAQKTFTGSMANVRAALKQVGQAFYEDLIVQEGPLVGLFGSLRTAIKTFKNEALPSIKAPAAFINELATVAKTAIDTLVDQGFFTSVAKGLHGIVEIFGRIHDAFVNVFGGDISEAVSHFTDIFDRLVRKLFPGTSALTAVERAFTALFSVLKIVTDLLGVGVEAFVDLLEICAPIFEGLLEIVGALGLFVTSGAEAANQTDKLSDGVENLRKFLQRIANTIGRVLKKVAQAIHSLHGWVVKVPGRVEEFKNKVTDAFEFITAGTGRFADEFGDELDESATALDRFKLLAGKALDRIKTKFQEFFDSVVNGKLVQGIKEKLETGFNNVIEWFKTLPERITQGIETIKKKWPEFVNTVTRIGAGVIGAPAIAIKTAFEAIKSAFDEFAQNEGPIADAVNTVTSTIQTKFDEFVNWLIPNTPKVQKNLKTLQSSLTDFPTKLRSGGFEYLLTVGDILGQFVGSLAEHFFEETPVGQGLVRFGKMVRDEFVQPMLNRLPSLDTIAARLKNFGEQGLNALRKVVERVTPSIQRRFQLLQIVFKAFMSRVHWPSLTNIATIIQKAFGTISSVLGGSVSAIGIVTGRLVTLFAELVTGSTETLGSFEDVINRFAGGSEMGQKLLDFFDNVKEKAEPLIEWIGGGYSNIAKGLGEFWTFVTGLEMPKFNLADFVAGLASGVQRLGDTLANWWGVIGEFFEPIVKWFQDRWADFVKSLNENKANPLAVIAILVFVLLVKDIFAAVKSIGTGMQSIGDIGKNIKAGFDSILKIKVPKLSWAQNVALVAAGLSVMFLAFGRMTQYIKDANPAEILTALAITGAVVVATFAIVKVLKRLATVWKDSRLDMSGTAKAVMATAVSIWLIVDAISSITKAVSAGGIAGIAGAVVGLLSVAAVMTLLIDEFIPKLGKMSHYLDAGRFAKLGVAMVIFGVAIRIIAGSIADIAAAVTNTANFGGAMVGLAAVAAVMELMPRVVRTISNIPTTSGRIMSAALGMVMVGVAVKIAVSAISDLMKALNNNKINGAFTDALFGVIGVMTLLAGIARTAENFRFTGGMGLVLVAIAVRMLVGVLASLKELSKTANGYDFNSTWMAIGQLSVLMVALGVFGRLAEGFTFGSGLAFRLVSSALDALIDLAIKVGEFISVSGNGAKLVWGLGITIGVLTLVGALMAAYTHFISKADRAGTGYEAAASIVAAVGALFLIGVVLHQLTDLKWSEMWQGLTAVGATLVVLGGVLGLMSRFGGIHLVAAAASLLLGSLSLLVIGGVLALLTHFNWSQIQEMAGAIALTILALGGALTLMGKFAGLGALAGAVALLGASLTLVVIAGVLILLQNMDLTSAVQNLSYALVALAGCVAILGLIGPMAVVGAAALLVAAIALVGVAAAIIVAAIGLTALVVPLTALSLLDLQGLGSGLAAVGGGLFALGVASIFFAVGLVAAVVGVIAAFAGLVVVGGLVFAVMLEIAMIAPIVALALYAIGKSAEMIGVGFANGLAAATGAVASAVSGFCNFVSGIFTGFFGIHSPSTLAMLWGAFTGQGFGEGIESMEGFVGDAASGLSMEGLAGLMEGATGSFDIGQMLGLSFSAGEKTAVPSSREAADANIAAAISGFKSGGDDANEAGFDLASMFGEGASSFDMESIFSQLGIEGMEGLEGLDFGALGLEQGADWQSMLLGAANPAETGSELTQEVATGAQAGQLEVEAVAAETGKKYTATLFQNVQSTMHQEVPPAVGAIADESATELAKTLPEALREKDIPIGAPVQDKLTVELESVDTASAASKVTDNLAGNLESGSTNKLLGAGGLGADSFLTGFGQTGTQKAASKAEEIFQAFHSTVPDYAGTGKAHGAQYVNGFKEGAAGMTEAANAVIQMGRAGLINAEGAYKPLGTLAGKAYTISLEQTKALAFQAASKVTNEALRKFKETREFKNAGENAGRAYANALSSPSIRSAAQNAASAIGAAAANGIGNHYNTFYNSGRNTAQGFIDGMNSKSSNVYTAAYNMGRTAVDALNKATQVQSPSKEGIRTGKFIGEGLSIGLRAMADNVADSGAYLGTASIDAMANTLGLLDDIDLDVEPTITPVLDLSNVYAGRNALNSIFSQDATVNAIAGHATIQAGVARVAAAQDASSVTPPAEIKYELTQNNYSPKALSRIDIYRDTKNLFGRVARTEVPYAQVSANNQQSR